MQISKKGKPEIPYNTGAGQQCKENNPEQKRSEPPPKPPAELHFHPSDRSPRTTYTYYHYHVMSLEQSGIRYDHENL